MRFPFWTTLLLCAGCAAHLAPSPTAPVALAPVREVTPAVAAAPPPAPVQAVEPEAPPVVAAPVAPVAEPVSEQVDEAPAPTPAPAVAEGSEDEPVASPGAPVAAGEDEPGEPGEPTTGAGNPVGNEPFFTADLTDEVLKELWKKDPKLLGPISVGFVQSGRMINAIPFPAGEGWDVVWPEKSWTTQETADYLIRAIREVRAQYARAPIIHVNQISAQDGGHLRPHKSHQNGRDVDLGFYYRADDDSRPRARESVMDMELDWALLKALIIHTDVQMIIVDKRIQKALHEYALGQGEDPKWLDSLFGGADPLFLHARGHRDHFHVRFFNPRAQELGRRIAPLLALQPEHNLMMHRVRSGDSLGKIAQHYGSSIGAIKKANHMTSILLRIGQTVAVPLHGACTQCPVPPPVNIPPRRLPPTLEQDAPAVAGDPVAAAEAPRPGGDSAALPASEPASTSVPEAQPASAMVP